MHILGLDFGTKTGVAYGDAGVPAARVTTETWALPAGGADSVGEILHVLRRRLDDRLMRGVSLVVFEAPFVTHHMAPNQTRRAYGFAGICEELAFMRGIEVREVVTSTLKKEFAGHGRADKAQMIRAAKRRGFAVANDHEADAAACWLHAVTHAQPALAAGYDPIFAAASRDDGGVRG